jgi:hypothetical protein
MRRKTGKYEGRTRKRCGETSRHERFHERVDSLESVRATRGTIRWSFRGASKESESAGCNSGEINGGSTL